MAALPQYQRVPPLPANLGQACYKCFAEHSSEKPISKCAACKRIGYCGSECQKGDWPQHKPICKALRSLENSGSSMSLHFFNLSDPTAGDTINTQELGEFARMSLHADIDSFEKILGVPLTVFERNLFGWEPRCAACGITERLLRVRAKEQGHTTSTQLQKCADCQSTFFCSPRHFALIKRVHATVPAAGGYDDLSQCQLNQRIREDVRLSNVLAKAKTDMSPRAAVPDGGTLTWAPERVMTEWKSLKGQGWSSEFMHHIQKEFPLPPNTSFAPFLRAATDALSLPMTILSSLEFLNGDDLSWTQKETLVVHILGASAAELQNSMVFEEIVHRLPKLKRLKLILCGPDMINFSRNPEDRDGTLEMEMDTCLSCQNDGRKRIQSYSTRLYHDYVKKRGGAFSNPDIAIAFNSGSSEEEISVWKETMKVLVGRKIPTVFTSYNEEEATKESMLLTEVGAQLIPELGPCRNQWGSMLLKTEPGRLDGFYNSSGWFAGGFN